MGKVAAYHPDPTPEADAASAAVSDARVHWHLCQMEEVSGHPRLLLPVALRRKWLTHPIHSVEWASLLQDFDNSMGLPASAPGDEQASDQPADGGDATWALDEPQDIDSLKRTYTISANFAGRGDYQFFVATVKQDSTESEQKDSEEPRLFVASGGTRVEIANSEYLLAHGNAIFVKDAKAQEAISKGQAALR